MGRVRQAAAFTRDIYRTRALVAWHGRLRRDPVALLQLGPGRDDPYPLYERVRSAGPLVPTPLGNWASAGHAICSEVLRDRRYGVRMPDDPPPQDGFDLSFLELDPPDHTRLRRLAAPAFSPRSVAGYRSLVETTVQDLLDRAERQGGFDLVSALAEPLPVAVISDLLGIPPGERPALVEHGHVVVSALDGIRSPGHAGDLLRSTRALESMFERLVSLRRTDPGEDVVSTLLHNEDRLSPHELVSMCSLLLVAGFETTVNLIGNGVCALLSHPEQWRLLCEQPERAADAVEEVLRFDPPVQRTARVAHETTELAGRPVRRGQPVLLLLGGANRDPDVFDAPQRFDITRDQTVEHLAFSSGQHYCLGAPLARMEGEIALRVLAERMPGLRQTGPPVLREGRTIRGPRRLPVAG